MLPPGLIAISLVLVHARSARSDTRALNWECSEQASDFRGEAGPWTAGGTVVAYTSYFNKQRHECLVEISSKRSNDGSVYDQIFNLKDGAFITSRTRPAGVQPMDDGVIDDGRSDPGTAKEGGPILVPRPKDKMMTGVDGE
jgi:hypothetical protein